MLPKDAHKTAQPSQQAITIPALLSVLLYDEGSRPADRCTTFLFFYGETSRCLFSH